MDTKKLFQKYYKIILCTVAIAYLCFSPADSYRNIKITIPHLDKLIHFTMFLGAGILLKPLITGISVKNKFLIIVLYIFYAALTEFIQFKYIPSRTGCVFDFIFDVAGLTTGLICYKHLPSYVKRIILK